MKNNKSFGLLIAILFLIFAACEPIEKRDVLENSYTPDDIQLEVIQSTPGGNQLSLRMNTPGVAGYWDYIIGTKYSDRVDLIFPLPGTSTFIFYVTTPYFEGGDIYKPLYVKKSIDVTITKLDHRLPEQYYWLVGDNLEGKTWVFDGVDEPGALWWYMVAGYNWKEFWWDAGADAPPFDKHGKIKFDLDGGSNFTYYESPTAAPVTGTTWVFNPDYTKLTLKGPADLPGSYEGSGGYNVGQKGVYQIKEFSANRLVLFIPEAEWGSGWIWVFKPAD